MKVNLEVKKYFTGTSWNIFAERWAAVARVLFFNTNLGPRTKANRTCVEEYYRKHTDPSSNPLHNFNHKETTSTQHKNKHTITMNHSNQQN